MCLFHSLHSVIEICWRKSNNEADECYCEFLVSNLTWTISDTLSFPFPLMRFCLFVCLFFRAAPYENSQARGCIGAVAAGLRQATAMHDPSHICDLYTTAHGNAKSLTHWARPGIEPVSSWILVRFFSAEPWWELRVLQILFSVFFGRIAQILHLYSITFVTWERALLKPE